MMKKDSIGNIIEDLPSTAKFVDENELLFIPYKDALSEYAPKAYNSVNMFFRQLGYVPFVDNLCDREWEENAKGENISEIAGICKVSFKKEFEKEAEQVISKLKEILTPSDKSSFENDIKNNTTLNVCFPVNNAEIKIELPYCTIAQISLKK